MLGAMGQVADTLTEDSWGGAQRDPENGSSRGRTRV